MRIGFLSDRYNDPERVGSWSGLPFFFARKMREAGCEVVPIRGGAITDSLSEKVKQAAWLMAGKRYLRGLNAGVLRAYARSVEPLLRSERVDAVFTVNSWMLAYLETDLPTAFWTDATFASMLGFYGSFSNLAPSSLSAGRDVERHALARCSVAGYASHWAARSAVTDHGADPERILVLPFGANLEDLPEPDTVQGWIETKTSEAAEPAICELSCIGVDWKRKGVDLAVAATEELRARGIPVRLRVAGCQPPPGTVLPPGVELLGFLDKNTAEGQERLRSLYRESHFFLLPSRAEAYGVVLSEAAVFGVPALTANVGGLADVVRPDETGQLFAPEAPASAYANWIESTWTNPEKYRQLARAALDHYHANLCGRKATEKLVARLRLLTAPEQLHAAAC